jgi:predicted MPP superfamily phosphohydrolase
MRTLSLTSSKTRCRRSSRAAIGPALSVVLCATLAACGGVSTNEPAGPAAVVTPAPAGPPVVPATPPATPAPIALPNQSGSLKFAVLGDFGTGEQPSYDLAAQMVKFHSTFPFDVVLLVGDNLYGGDRQSDYAAKFERPYKPLLDAKVKFYASLGNHDTRNQRFYEHFNMDGKLYYSFKAPSGSVRFYALESTNMDPDQVAWIDKELKDTTDEWKIVYLHHPLYSSARRHGSDLPLRRALAPLFIRYNVSVVLQGHDHVYERVKPQDGIVYFVVGSGGKLRTGDLSRTSVLTAKGYDADLTFMACEIIDDNMYFNAVSRTGAIVDSGIVLRRQPPK